MTLAPGICKEQNCKDETALPHFNEQSRQAAAGVKGEGRTQDSPSLAVAQRDPRWAGHCRERWARPGRLIRGHSHLFPQKTRAREHGTGAAHHPPLQGEGRSARHSDKGKDSTGQILGPEQPLITLHAKLAKCVWFLKETHPYTRVK